MCRYLGNNADARTEVLPTDQRCQRDCCQQVIDSGGDDFLVVEDNRAEFREAIEAEFQPAVFPGAKNSASTSRASDVQKVGPHHPAASGVSSRLAKNLDWRGLA